MATRVAQLAAQIQEHTAVYTKWLAESKRPEPSFDASYANQDDRRLAPPNVIQAIEATVEATDELHNLLLGPFNYLMGGVTLQGLRPLALSFIHKHRLAELVPLEGGKSYEDLAKETKLDVDDLRRVVRLAITERLFEETEAGLIIHTAATRTLHDQPLLASFVGMTTEENIPAMQKLPEAVAKWPGSQEPNQTAWQLGHNTEKTPFDIMQTDPRRAKQFGEAMTFGQMDPALSVNFFIDTYDFASIKNGTFVDVGGSHGHVSIAIAQRFPNLKFIVQDLPPTVAEGKAKLPADVADRVSFQDHDFFTPQPVKGADIYYMRWIFHDWPDRQCIQILKSLVPALEKGNKIIINDLMMPPKGLLSKYQERWPRGFDVAMKAVMNGKERDGGEWVALFMQADPRFKLVNISVPPGSKFGVIEVEWTG